MITQYEKNIVIIFIIIIIIIIIIVVVVVVVVVVKLAFFTCTIFLYFGLSKQVSLSDIMCSFIGFFVQC